MPTAVALVWLWLLVLKTWQMPLHLQEALVLASLAIMPPIPPYYSILHYLFLCI